MTWLPSASAASGGLTALPLATATGEPTSTPSTVNCTWPVAVAGVNEAVKVTAPCRGELACDEPSATAVAARTCNDLPVLSVSTGSLADPPYSTT